MTCGRVETSDWNAFSTDRSNSQRYRTLYITGCGDRRTNGRLKKKKTHAVCRYVYTESGVRPFSSQGPGPQSRQAQRARCPLKRVVGGLALLDPSIVGHLGYMHQPNVRTPNSEAKCQAPTTTRMSGGRWRSSSAAPVRG